MKCVNDHCPFNSDEANDGCLIIPEDIKDNMDGECPKKIVVARVEADKDRLDWILESCDIHVHGDSHMVNLIPSREAIDKARK